MACGWEANCPGILNSRGPQRLKVRQPGEARQDDGPLEPLELCPLRPGDPRDLASALAVEQEAQHVKGGEMRIHICWVRRVVGSKLLHGSREETSTIKRTHDSLRVPVAAFRCIMPPATAASACVSLQKCSTRAIPNPRRTRGGLKLPEKLPVHRIRINNGMPPN